MIAAFRGNPEIARFLIEKNADVNAKTIDGQTALMIAAENGHRDVRFLIEKGADINAQDKRGWTALTLAAYEGKKEVVIFLARQRH